MPRIDLTGTKIGRLSPLEYTLATLSSGRKMSAWKCRCDCGTELTILTVNLRKPNHTTSCGCYAKETVGTKQRTHGMSGTRPYRVWRSMLDRCHNERDYHFKWYGARGISVCHRWRFGEDGKPAFLCWRDDMGPKPTPKHTLERVNNNGNYEPSNCIWATMSEQARNQRPPTPKPHVPRSHCRHGHAMAGDNVYIIPKRGTPTCRTCALERLRASKERRKRALTA